MPVLSIRMVHFRSDTAFKIYDILNYKYVDTMDLLCLCFIWNGKLYIQSPIRLSWSVIAMGQGVFLAFSSLHLVTVIVIRFLRWLFRSETDAHSSFTWKNKVCICFPVFCTTIKEERRRSSRPFHSNSFLVNCINHALKVFPRIIRSHALEIYRRPELRFTSSEHRASLSFFLRN